MVWNADPLVGLGPRITSIYPLPNEVGGEGWSLEKGANHEDRRLEFFERMVEELVARPYVHC